MLPPQGNTGRKRPVLREAADDKACGKDKVKKKIQRELRSSNSCWGSAPFGTSQGIKGSRLFFKKDFEAYLSFLRDVRVDGSNGGGTLH